MDTSEIIRRLKLVGPWLRTGVLIVGDICGLPSERGRSFGVWYMGPIILAVYLSLKTYLCTS